MAKTISKDMIINEIIQVDSNLIALLMGVGMHCIGCPSAQGETLEEACMVHGLDADEVEKTLNDYLAKNNK
jgi:hybrid cluster-associated redox disulfide protein